MKMKKPVLAAMALMSVASVCPALTHPGATVGSIQSFYNGADCFYFTLVGVSPADGAVSGSDWFAVSRSQYGAKDAMATLIAAKAASLAVKVSTTGTAVCGYAGVSEIVLE